MILRKKFWRKIKFCTFLKLIVPCFNSIKHIMILLPIEIILLILERLDRRDVVQLLRTNKFLSKICSKFVYSEVIIEEKYDYSRFPITRKFIRTMSLGSVSCIVKSLTIRWEYPPKINMGFDSFTRDFRVALLNMRSLVNISLCVRLRDKSFNECFSSGCMFKLEKFECNFGTHIDKKRFLENHGLS
jgi:hypothetical protein